MNPARTTCLPALAGALCVLGLALPPATVSAGQVVLLKSRGSSAYDAAALGFLSAFRGKVVPLSLEDGTPDELAQRLRTLRPDAVVAVGLRAATLARAQLPRTPLIYCVIHHPERHDLRGEWVTGISTDIAPATELDALCTAAPDVRRVAVFFGTRTGGAFMRAARAAAKGRGLELIEVPIAQLSDLAIAAERAAGAADALWLPGDATVATPETFRFLLELSLVTRKPLLVFSESLVRAGALAAISPDYGSVGEQVAAVVRRILAGERPGDIPVASVRRTRLVVNGSTARLLGRELSHQAMHDAEVLP